MWLCISAEKKPSIVIYRLYLPTYLLSKMEKNWMEGCDLSHPNIKHPVGWTTHRIMNQQNAPNIGSFRSHGRPGPKSFSWSFVVSIITCHKPSIFPYANHGAGICTPTFARTKSPSHVGFYIPAPWFAYGFGVTPAGNVHATIQLIAIPSDLLFRIWLQALPMKATSLTSRFWMDETMTSPKHWGFMSTRDFIYQIVNSQPL